MAAKALSFDVGDYVVYPKHGVGRVVELQRQEIAGMQLELYVLRFEKERMTLRVPTNKAESVGMRKLSSDKTLREALDTLTGKPKVKRTMWSRRAQEYEAKINSGDLVSIAEVSAICSARGPARAELFRRQSLKGDQPSRANSPRWAGREPTAQLKMRISCEGTAIHNRTRCPATGAYERKGGRKGRPFVAQAVLLHQYTLEREDAFPSGFACAAHRVSGMAII